MTMRKNFRFFVSDHLNNSSDLSVNHHFCSIISPYPSKQIWKYLHVRNQQQQGFNSSNFETCRFLAKKDHFSFSSLGFEIEKSYDSETSGIQASLIQGFSTISDR